MGARLSLLGGFELQCSEGAAPVVLPKKARALLALLSVSRGRAQSRERLAGLLWADSSEAHARMSLRKTLSAIRRALPEAGAGLIVTDVESVRLATDTLGSDVLEFEALVADGSPTAHESALRLYRGELLEGFAASEPEFELWRATERERLHRLAVDCAVALLGHFERRGAFQRAIEIAAHAISLDPLREELHRTVMRLHARLGHPELALKQYRVCRALLEKDLGVPTEPETDRLFREIQEQRRRPAGVLAADGASVREVRAGPVAAVAGEIESPAREPDPPQHIELRQAAILFFEMPALEDATDEADWEMAHRFVVHCRETVGRVVSEHGGTVVAHTGGRSMAVFGIPTAHGNDAERAVRAAFALRQALSGLQLAPARDPRVHIGIATGQVLCSQHTDGINLTGSACRDGARIVEAAAQGEVWISERVYGALHTAIDAEPVEDAARIGLTGQAGSGACEASTAPGPPIRLDPLWDAVANCASFSASWS